MRQAAIVFVSLFFLAGAVPGTAPQAPAESPYAGPRDGAQPSWTELEKRFHPDEAERHKLFDEELPRIREMVREEFLQDLDWK